MNLRPIALLLLLAAAGAHAQTRPAPGLWEYTSRMASSDPRAAEAMARMQQQLASMPPEQRQQMEAMMAQRGLSMPGAAPGGGMVIKTCLTAEQAARDESALPPDSRCKLTSQSRSGNTFKFTMACAAPREGSGEGEVTYVSPKEHHGRIKMTAASKPGKAAPGGAPGDGGGTMEMSYQAKWLAASCGDVKPR